MSKGIGLRIKELRESENLTQIEFSERIGIKQANLSHIENKGEKISVDIINRIISNFNISVEWLFTGIGGMAKNSSVALDQADLYRKNSPFDKHYENQDIPIYDIHAAAGLNLLFEGNKQNIIDTIRIPNMSKCDGALFVTGDSMYPLIKSGDIVLFKQVNSIEYLHYGDIYLLSYNINGDDFFVLKYIQKSEREDHLKLVSYNKHHSPIDIPISAINAIALVKANVRYNTMQ